MKKKPKPPQRTSLELEFLPEYLEILERPPASVARYFVATIMVMAISVVAWASLGSIDIIARSTGRLVVQDKSKIIQAPASGEIVKIAVRDGHYVKAGDLLVELNPISAAAERDRLVDQLVTQKLEIARLEALLSDDPEGNFKLPQGVSHLRATQTRNRLLADANNFRAQMQSLESQAELNRIQQRNSETIIKHSEALINWAREQVNSRRQLVDEGFFPALQFKQLERDVLIQERNMAEVKAEKARLVSEAVEITERKNQLEAETRKALLDQVSERRDQLTYLGKELVKADEQLRKMKIVAPIDGIVQQMAISTLGGVVQPAQPLMVIVPDAADLYAEVMILSKDIGFIRSGQHVEVKIDSFPYTKYGTIKGEVLNVSRDSVKNERLGLVYPAHVKLASQIVETNTKSISLSPGMSLTAEIKTGDRRIIDYLLSPLKEYQSEALKER